MASLRCGPLLALMAAAWPPLGSPKTQNTSSSACTSPLPLTPDRPRTPLLPACAHHNRPHPFQCHFFILIFFASHHASSAASLSSLSFPWGHAGRCSPLLHGLPTRALAPCHARVSHSLGVRHGSRSPPHTRLLQTCTTPRICWAMSCQPPCRLFVLDAVTLLPRACAHRLQPPCVRPPALCLFPLSVLLVGVKS